MSQSQILKLKWESHEKIRYYFPPHFFAILLYYPCGHTIKNPGRIYSSRINKFSFQPEALPQLQSVADRFSYTL